MIEQLEQELERLFGSDLSAVLRLASGNVVVVIADHTGQHCWLIAERHITPLITDLSAVPGDWEDYVEAGGCLPWDALDRMSYDCTSP